MPSTSMPWDDEAQGVLLVPLARFFALISVACLPLNHAFAYGQFVTFSFVSALLALILGLAGGVGVDKRVAIAAGGFPCILLFMSFLSFFLSGMGDDASKDEIVKSLRTNVFLLVYGISLGVIFRLIDRWSIIRLVTVGILFASVYGIADVLLQQNTSITLDSFIYRFTTKENPGSLGANLRLRSTLEEPGAYAFYMDALFPWALVYALRFWQRQRWKITLLLVAGLVSFFMTLSAAGFAIFCFLTLIFGLYHRNPYLFIPGLVFLVAVIWLNTAPDAELLQVFFSKYTGEDESAVDRRDRVNFVLNVISVMWENQDILPIMVGHGPAWVMSQLGTGLVNVYLYIFVEFGLLGVSLVLGFYWWIWRRSLKGDVGLPLYSFIAALAHFVFIQNYYYLFLPFMLALLSAFKINRLDEL